MSSFAEVMQTNPPRLVVAFQRGTDGSENFQWGVQGAIPILSLIGHISTVQVELIEGAWMPECDSNPPGQYPPCLALTWDARDRSLAHFMHPDIPREPLVGMLETIKAALVTSRLAQHVAAQRTQILGPDGQPMRL